MVDGMFIGVKTMSGDPVLVDDLMSQQHLDVHPSNLFGILIPHLDILNRRKFEWFARLSEQQVMESRTIIGNYILLASASLDVAATIRPAHNRSTTDIVDKWISFWKVPSGATVWGFRPNGVGSNVPTA